jgi:hypothetical protein
VLENEALKNFDQKSAKTKEKLKELCANNPWIENEK